MRGKRSRSPRCRALSKLSLKFPLFAPPFLDDISHKHTSTTMKHVTTSLILALAIPAAADIITLKDGTKLDAEILSKTLEEYELEVSVTSSIKERRTVKRSDVVDVETVNAADSIFEEKIAGLVPIPPYTPLEDYDERIEMINKFLVPHEMTAAGTKAKRMLKELTEERDFIKKGGIKTSLEGDGMIDAETRKANALEIDSQIEGAKFQSYVQNRNFLAALRQYDILEGDFFATQAHRDSMVLMSRLSNVYATLLERDLASLEDKMVRREEAFDRLSSSDQSRAMQAEEQRRANFDRLWAKEEEDGQLWFTVDPQNASSLEGAIDSLAKEAERVAAVNEEMIGVPVMGELYREGWIAATEKKQVELESILDQMEEIGVKEDYLNRLIDEFDPNINNPPEEEEEVEMEGKEEMMDEKMMDDEKMMGEEKMMDDKKMMEEETDTTE